MRLADHGRPAAYPKLVNWSDRQCNMIWLPRTGNRWKIQGALNSQSKRIFRKE